MRSPASCPEYDPWATPKPHADSLIDIPMAEAASASDPRRPLSPPKYVARGSTAEPKSQHDIHGHQVTKEKPKWDARMQPPNLMLGQRLPTCSATTTCQ